MIEKGRSTSSARLDKTLSLYSYESQRQLPEVQFVDTNEIRQEWLSELKCLLCSQTLKKTKVTPCLHRFCAGCINGRKHCPKCKELIFQKNLIKNDTNTDAIIAKFSIVSKRDRVCRGVSEVNHLFFSKRRKPKRLQNGINSLGSIPGTSSAASSPIKTVRPIKRPFNKVDTEDETCSLGIRAFLSNNNNTTLKSNTGSSPISPVTLVTNGVEKAVENGICAIPTNGAREDVQGLTNGNLATEPRALSQSGPAIAPVIALQRMDISALSSDVSRTVTRAQVEGPAVLYFVDAPNQDQTVIAVSADNAVNTTPNLQEMAAGPSCLRVHAVEVPERVISSSHGTAAKSAITKHESGLESSANIGNPFSPEGLFFFHRQHLYPECETEVILSPHASIFSEDYVGRSTRRPHFVFCESRAKVEHLCAFVLRRAMISTGGKFPNKKVELCVVKTELSAKDVFIMKTTGEGKYSAIEICSPAEANSFYLFSIQYPFKALDEERTVGSLKEEFSGGKMKPLRLVYRFVNISA